MLGSKASRYVASNPQPPEYGPGLYYPDSVVDAVVEEARKLTPTLYKAHLGQPEEFALLDAPTAQAIKKRFTLEESKQLIIKAFSDFDPELGRRARVIFDDPARWNLQEVPAGECRMMRSRPAGSQGDQYNPPNPLPHSVIDYEFDGTIDGLIYLAHEVGHSIADDYAREAGGSYQNTPGHLNEFQAYLPQQIIYDSLMLSSDPETAEAAKRQYLATMATSLYNLPLSLNAKMAETALLQEQAPSHATMQEWFGDDWNRHPRTDDIIKTIGATREDTGSGSLLEQQIQSMHERPLGVLVSAGLYNHLKTQDPATRSRTLETLFRPFDENGSRGISEILATSGIEHSSQMKALAHSALKSTADLLNAPQAQVTRQSTAAIGISPSGTGIA
jgi:hypothetical protein